MLTCLFCTHHQPLLTALTSEHIQDLTSMTFSLMLTSIILPQPSIGLSASTTTVHLQRSPHCNPVKTYDTSCHTSTHKAPVAPHVTQRKANSCYSQQAPQGLSFSIFAPVCPVPYALPPHSARGALTSSDTGGTPPLGVFAFPLPRLFFLRP